MLVTSAEAKHSKQLWSSARCEEHIFMSSHAQTESDSLTCRDPKLASPCLMGRSVVGMCVEYGSCGCRCVCVFVSCCPLLHACPAGSSPPATSLPQPQYAHHTAEAGEIISLLPLRHSESHQALLWATHKTSSRLQLSCSGLEHCFCSGTRWMCRSPQAQHLHYHHSSGKRLLYEEDLYMNHGNCSNKCCGNMQRKSA